MRTNYVLIDYENVQVKSLSLLMEEQFHVKVFLGPKNSKLSTDFVLAMKELGDRADYILMETSGSNALDFHIAFYIGALATTDPTAFFHIISKDTGFDPLINHLKEKKKIFSKRSASIEEMPCFLPVPAAKIENVSNEVKVTTKPKGNSAKSLLDELTKVALNDLIKRKNSKPRTKQTLLNTIQNSCGKEKPMTEIEAVFKSLVKKGYVKISGEKVTYAPPSTPL